MNKKFLCWIIIITCILLFLNNCITEKIPAIRFVNDIYNFGEVAEGTEVAYTFTFQNSGTDMLEITSVKPTCGCTVSGVYTKEVAPKKLGEIPVVFKTKGFRGPVSKTIRVETNIPDSETIIITIEGKINVLLEVNPDSLWFGKTEKDGPPLTETVTIKNHIDTPLKIMNIKSSGENCTTKINTIIEGKEYAIDITISPPFKMKQVKETLTIMTNIKERELIKIKYQYFGQPDIEVSHNEIIISRKYLQPDLSLIVTVKSNNDKTFDIINPRILNGENIELRLAEVIPGKNIQIRLQFAEKFEFPKNKTPTISFGVKSEQEEKMYTIPIIDADKL